MSILYADVLRVGEDRRDASDKIRGYTFQDLVTIHLLLESDNNSYFYIEWVEDIYIENDNEIFIYQVKYYPLSRLDLNDIYLNLFYQFLKYKFLETDKKSIKTYCFSYSNGYKDVDEDSIINRFSDNKSFDIKRDEMINKIGTLKFKDKIDLVIKEIGSKDLLNEFEFEKIDEKKNIILFKDKLKDKLYEYLDKNNLLNKTILGLKNGCEIVLAIAIQFIQNRYLSNGSVTAKERRFTKDTFIDYLVKTLSINKASVSKLIKFAVLNYIDELYSDINDDITDDGNLIIYKELYQSTKLFLIKILDNKHLRFKFLNSISTNDYDSLNFVLYNKCSDEDELEIYYEHKDKIKYYVLMIWKILFDMGCKNFDSYIREYKDYYLIEFPSEKLIPAILIPTNNGLCNLEARKVLSRIKLMENKPKKWYFRGNYKDYYYYNYSVDKPKSLDQIKAFNPFHINQEEIFKIECMTCIKYDIGYLEDKDCIDCILRTECINKEI